MEVLGKVNLEMEKVIKDLNALDSEPATHHLQNVEGNLAKENGGF